MRNRAGSANRPNVKRFVLVAAAILGLACGARAQDGPIQGTTTNVQGQARPGTNVAICQNLATTGASVTNNVATYTFGSNPQTLGFVIGATLTAFGFTGGDTFFNGTFTISATSATTISVNLVHANAAAGTNGNVYQTGSTSQACAAIATTFTDQTGATTMPNPFTSDGLGNYLTFVAPGYYRVQLYGPGVTTLLYPTAVACVPNNAVNCGALLGTPNTWTALQTFNAGITSAGSNTFGGGVFSGTWTGAPTLSGLWTFNGGVTVPVTANLVASNIVPTAPGAGIIGLSTNPYVAINIGSAANLLSSITSLASANRPVALPDAGGTVSFAVIEYCGATTGATQACAKTVQTLPIIVWGDVLLNGAVSQSITTLPFTDALYSCWGSDLTTATGIVSFNTYASASVTIQESGGTNADHLRWGCSGH